MYLNYWYWNCVYILSDRAGYNNSMKMQVNIKETWEGRTDLGGFWSYDINLYSLEYVTFEKRRKREAIYSLKKKKGY